jgi:hypothetical protein
VKKILSIIFVLVFMIQALPVMHWVYGPGENNVVIEMSEDKEKGEKDLAEKESGKDCKENIIPNRQFYNKYSAYKSYRHPFQSTENAIILHHADISTPPPDING